MIIQAENPIGAKPGDLVVVSSDTTKVLGAAAVMYLIPLVAFFVGYAVGSILEIGGALMGCIGFLLGVFAPLALDRHRAKKEKNVYTIVRFAPKKG